MASQNEKTHIQKEACEGTDGSSPPTSCASDFVLKTKLTSMMGIRHPIINAPMCGMAMGALAGSVAKAGGIGLIGESMRY